MGIDVQGLNLLKFAFTKMRLGRVATIGRQVLLIPKKKWKKLLPSVGEGFDIGDYCEDLLRDHFSAIEVESYDNSDYEKATHIIDMNKPVDIKNTYDTIIDFGCLEHIYNAPQALKNISSMCCSGGQILHVLPANDFCGHGFWQFSPELFFSLYSKANGYQETQVFVADQFDGTHWYEVKRPSNGKRAMVCSRDQYVIVRTVKGTHFSHDNVQQSDYVHLWESRKDLRVRQNEFSVKAIIKSALRITGLLPFAYFVYRQLYWRFIADRLAVSLSSWNPNLIKHCVSKLLSKG